MRKDFFVLIGAGLLKPITETTYDLMLSQAIKKTGRDELKEPFYGFNFQGSAYIVLPGRDEQ